MTTHTAAAPPTSLGWKLAKVTAPVARTLAGRRFFPLWAVLRHQGRKSGQEFAIPVVVQRIPGGVLVPLPFGRGTNWARNVLAAGGCTIRWKGVDRRMVHPRVVDQATGAAEFGRFQAGAIRRLGIDAFLRLEME